MQAEDEEERQKSEVYKLLASEQRAAVSHLYLDRNRPSFDNNVSKNFYTLIQPKNHLCQLFKITVLSKAEFLAGTRKLCLLWRYDGRDILWREKAAWCDR